jgi:hypothetical protein
MFLGKGFKKTGTEVKACPYIQALTEFSVLDLEKGGR